MEVRLTGNPRMVPITPARVRVIASMHKAFSITEKTPHPNRQESGYRLSGPRTWTAGMATLIPVAPDLILAL